MGTKRIVATVLAALTFAAVPSRAETPVIDVIGRRQEAARISRPGQSTAVQPMDPSRQDTAAQLSRDASLALPETGRINASGFVVPRVRGQDTRQTEVYVDDVLLQDPYTGLPLVDELDLRAFGELAWHLGVSPPEVHSLNPGGTMIYRLRSVNRKSAQAGLVLGQPYGSAVWAAALERLPANGQGHFYARQHSTDGRYRYYSDNGTPYSTDDDEYRIRSNNDRRSWQLVPAYDVTVGAHSLRLLGVLTESDQGIPSLAANHEGSAREASASRLGTVRWAYRPALADTAWMVPSRIAVHGATTRDAHRLDDPDRDILGAGDEASLAVSGRRGGLDASWEGDDALLESSLASGAADVHAEGSLSEQHASRYSSTGYLGLRLTPWSDGRIEAKGSAQRFRDLGGNDSVDSASGKEARTFEATGLALAFGQSVGPLFGYLQAARASRAPSLLEEFGDGGRVLDNPDLKPEKTRHAEIGTEWRAPGGDWHLGVAAFRDETKEKILLLPALAQATRAQNLGDTRVNGLETRADTMLDATLIYGSMTWLEARDLTGGGDRPLPFVPARTGSVGVEQTVNLADGGVERAVFRWLARYQSEVFRDRAASVVVPGGWIHDAYADVHLPFTKQSASENNDREASVGLAVLNIFDVTRIDVNAPGTSANHGRTAYSDREGYPLPGRQWRLSVEGHF